ncbi:hypothetical protein VHEMI09633 [[Torrubiella] hemipterigena]|uniref:EthD domain-containing protein n=1 Tax=[Torrubiella] hemipterigena TaxID=1531966 RepID=A0A0A1TGT7_9HYPO|nr:hypothetical protein VHEMI09633 [[Torrubiella] hemipterigena]
MSDTTATTKRSLAWTVCGSRRDGMSEEEFRHYMTNVHAPLVREALARHGITGYTMCFFDSTTKGLLDQVMGGQQFFTNETNYDIITQVRFPDVQCWINFQNDPFYKEKVAPDHHRFTNPDRVFINIGWVEDFIIDGKIVA